MKDIYRCTKIKSYPIAGQYKSTILDKLKDESQLLLKSCDPKIVHAKIELKGTGIKKYSTTGIYQVSNSAWNKLKSQYSWMTDF